MNYFISQFGNPHGIVGRLFSKMMNMSNKKMYAANLKHISGKTSKVLEIGFGNGRQLEMIKAYYPECAVYGIDISEDMYEAAGERLGDKAFLTLGRAEKLPYDENKFDVIITTDTCYFWDEPDTVLAEIFRTLKDKGIFVNSYNTMYAGAVKRSNQNALGDDKAILSAAGRQGFVPAAISRIGVCERQIVLSKNYREWR